MNDDYKILRNRANYLLMNAILHAVKILLLYILVYFLASYIAIIVRLNGRFELESLDYSTREVLYFIPKLIPLDQSTLTGLCALILALFINVRSEVKDIDELSRNAQIRAVSYKKFANSVMYIVSFIIFSHSINTIYKIISDGCPIENFNPSLLILIFFATFMLIVSALPGENRLSLEGQWKDKLNSLVLLNNINIKNKIDFSNISQITYKDFYKYYSAYSYNKPYLSYIASISGYISFRNYLFFCITYYLLVSLMFVSPVVVLYFDILVYNPMYLLRLFLVGFVGNFILSMVYFFIYPLPVLFPIYKKGSFTEYYPLQILHYISLSIFWGGVLSYTGIRLIEVFHNRHNVKPYNIFEVLGILWYIFLIIFIPTGLWLARQIFIKYIGKKTLNVSKFSVDSVLHFAESWYKWTEAMAIYKEAFFYRNSIDVEDLEIPETNYSEFLYYYSECKNKSRELNKHKQYGSTLEYVLPGDTRVKVVSSSILTEEEFKSAKSKAED